MPPETWWLFLKGKPMLNQNPNWQRLWIVNFEEQIVTHADGWVFKFTKIADGVFDGQMIKQPEHLTPEQIINAPKIAKEAGEVWMRARKNRH